MLEWLWIEGDHVWYFKHTVNWESGDPALPLSSCELGQVLHLSGSQFAHPEK